MDILETAPKKKEVNQFVVVMTNRYATLAKEILTPREKVALVARIFPKHWLLTDKLP